MSRKRTLQELTIKDNFMFGAVMSDEYNCRRLLELILQFPIERIVVSKEKSMIYHPGYKGVQLDVYAQDENNTHYDVEIKQSREMEGHFMFWEQIIRDEKEDARAVIHVLFKQKSNKGICIS